jgi:hypothetical protein
VRSRFAVSHDEVERVASGPGILPGAEDFLEVGKRNWVKHGKAPVRLW